MKGTGGAKTDRQLSNGLLFGVGLGLCLVVAGLRGWLPFSESLRVAQHHAFLKPNFAAVNSRFEMSGLTLELAEKVIEVSRFRIYACFFR